MSAEKALIPVRVSINCFVCFLHHVKKQVLYFKYTNFIYRDVVDVNFFLIVFLDCFFGCRSFVYPIPNSRKLSGSPASKGRGYVWVVVGCTFGLSQKYQKDKADEGMLAKATREIIHAIRAVREMLLVF